MNNVTDCFRCKGSAIPKQKTHVVNLDKCVIIVKNVPSFVCKQCGEAYLQMMQKLEGIIGRLENIIKEVAIVDYADSAA